MALRSRLRPLRALAIEANTDRVAIHLKDDSPIDAAKVMELCAAKRSPWKLTPDMKLSRRFEGGTDGVTNAERMLAEIDAA